MLLGGLGFLLGYGVTYLFSAETVRRDGVGFGRVPLNAADPASLWQAIGWLYVTAHRVPVTLRTSFGYSKTLTMSEGPAWTPVMWGLPVAAVAIVAAVAAVRFPSARLGDSIARGFWVWPGYALAVALGVVLFGWSTSRAGLSMRVTTDTVRAAVYAGLVYPVAGGVVGGGLGFLVASLRRRVGGPNGQGGETA